MLSFENDVLHIEGVSASDLAERYQTPLYIYDGAVIRRQIDRVKNAFRGLPFRPFYAMKANSALAILDLVRKSGFG